MAAHARLSASAAHRWIPCPGSVKLNARLPDTRSAFADEGTRAHEEAAACLLERKLAADPAVQVYVDYCQQQTQPGDVPLVEHDLTPGLRKLDADLGGTADFVRYRGKTQDLLVADFKYGAGVFVEVDGNPQLMLYALGAILSLPYDVRKVTIAVIQPRAEGADGPVREWVVPAHVIVDFAADVVEAARQTRADAPPLTPGEKQCRFCKARASCPALEAQTHALVAAEFDTVAVATDPGRLSMALDMIPTIEARIKALRDFAYGELAHGRQVPGYKLVAKRATRKWADEAAAKAALSALGEERFEPLSLKSPAAIEKLVGKKGFAQYAALAPAVSSGYTLASDSDSRPAVTLIAEQDFPAIGGPAEEQQ